MIGKQLTTQLIGEQSTEQRCLDTWAQLTRCLHAVHTMDDLFACVAQQVPGAFESDLAVLTLFDGERDRYCGKICHPCDQQINRFDVEREDDVCAHVMATGEPVLIDREQPEPSIGEVFARKLPWAVGSAMIVPVPPVSAAAPGQGGLLLILDQRDDCFSTSDLDRCVTVGAQVGLCAAYATRADAQHRQLESLAAALSSALDARDAVTHSHSINVANYAVAIGALLGLDDRHQRWLKMAAMLQDVGKIGTPDHLLSKAGRLEPHDYDQIKKHAAYTRTILSQVEFTEEYRDLAVYAAGAHERLDGSGYPDGLAGTQVPLKARILAVADMIVSLTEPRRHRPGMALHAAVSVLDDLVPGQLDSRCVAALKAFLGIGPLPTAAA